MHCIGDGPAARERRLKNRGFTLIEILVVVVIIGVMVSIATLAMGVLGRDSEVEDQSRRFWAVLRQAREESELQGLDVGVAVTPTDYAFMRFDTRENAWVPIENDKLYAPRKLPEGLRFRLWLDDREVVLKPVKPKKEDEKKKKDLLNEDEETTTTDARLGGERPAPDPDQPTPQIVVLSSGDIMPFELQIERDGVQSLWRVVGQADNDLRVERRVDESRWQMIMQTLMTEDEQSASDKNAVRKK
jgi:general secretion pathway protein H